MQSVQAESNRRASVTCVWAPLFFVDGIFPFFFVLASIFLVWKPIDFTVSAVGRVGGHGVWGCRRDCEKVQKMIQNIRQKMKMNTKMKIKGAKSRKGNGAHEMVRVATTCCCCCYCCCCAGAGNGASSKRHKVSASIT